MMLGMKKLWLLALPALVLLTACAPEPLVRPETPAPGPADEIAALIERERYDEALATLEDLLGREEDQGARARLRLEVAEQLLDAQEPDAARSLLAQVPGAALEPFDQARLALAWAELALLDGDTANAGWMLAQVREDLPARLAARHERLEERLRALQDQPAREALQSLESSLRRGDFEPELALALLIDYPLATLESLYLEHGGRPALQAWLDLALTARRFLLDDEQLRPALQAWQQRHPRAGYTAAEAISWLTAWRQIQPSPGRVAVLLPGPDSALSRPGRALRDGLLSAWARQPIPQRPELMFFHLDDAPEAVIGAWFSARERQADFVIGPLAREQVDALLALRDGALPVLLLNHPSQRRSLSEFPGLVSALALTPEEEAEIAAVRALVDGHRRALVLRQDSDWGDRVGNAFADTFRLGGGRIVRDMRYPAAQVDHTILLEVLLGLDRSRERASALQRLIGAPLESEPARRTDVDVIFLASRADDGRALRPQLKFFGAGDLPVMATSHIVSGAPDPRRDHDLEDVLIPLAPWFLDGNPHAQRRAQAEQLYGGLDNATLSRLFALGVDAVTLLPWLDVLRSDPALHLPGLTGRLSIDPHGLVERDLPIVRLVGGRPVPE